MFRARCRARRAWTLGLAAAAILIAAAVGGFAGVLGATRRASPIDYAATVLALAGVSTPIFWSGLILILVFAVPFLLVNLIVDVSYGLLDPRVRVE